MCGTAGCAIGECPIIFPEDWYFDLWGLPVIKEKEHTMQIGTYFFNISADEYRHLFVPHVQKPVLYGGKLLTASATRYEVANNILEFIKAKTK